MTTRADRVETAAQLIHEQRHRLGHAHVCDSCRALARRVADILDPPSGQDDPSEPAP